MCVEKTMHLPCLVAQPAQRLAQRTRGQHVEAIGRLVEDQVRRVVNDRARQRRLHALALREAFGAAVEQRLHLEHVGQQFGARRGGIGRHAVQAAVVDDVLARRQPRVQATRIGQHAHARQRALRRLRDVDAIDDDAPGIGHDQRGGHAQRRRLAGAVGAEQAGDAPVFGLEADVGHRLHAARLLAAALREALRQVAAISITSRPPSSSIGANIGGRGIAVTQLASTFSASSSVAASTKRYSTSRMQPMPITPWPALGTTHAWPSRPAPGHARAVARRRHRVEAARQHQRRRRCRRHRVERVGHAAARDRRAGLVVQAGEGAAEINARLIGGAVQARKVFGADDGEVHARGHLRAAPPAERHRHAGQRLEAPARRFADRHRQRGGERRHVQRPAHHAEQRLARQLDRLAAAGQRMRQRHRARQRRQQRTPALGELRLARVAQPLSFSQASNSASSAAWLSAKTTPAAPCPAAPRRRSPRAARAAETGAGTRAPRACRMSRRRG